MGVGRLRSRRRAPLLSSRGARLLVGVAPVLAAFVFAGAASAQDWTVQVAPPGPRGTPVEVRLTADFPRVLSVHPGDTVHFHFGGLHTVTFLPQGGERPLLGLPVPAQYEGFKDAAGDPFWFDGSPLPTIEVEGNIFGAVGGSGGDANGTPNPQSSGCQGSGTEDGTAYRNSGLNLNGDLGLGHANASAVPTATFTLCFPKVGVYRYSCVIHNLMKAAVKVVPRAKAIPSPRQVASQVTREVKSAVKLAKRLDSYNPGGNTVSIGHDQGEVVSLLKFFPQVKTIHAGETIDFQLNSHTDDHTVVFGSPAARKAVGPLFLATPQPAGPPHVILNPIIEYGTDSPPLPPYTGQNHGDGLQTSGLISGSIPAFPNSVQFTFTTPGTYSYECLLHPGMTGVVKVLA
jgi:plastocyanin